MKLDHKVKKFIQRHIPTTLAVAAGALFGIQSYNSIVSHAYKSELYVDKIEACYSKNTALCAQKTEGFNAHLTTMKILGGTTGPLTGLIFMGIMYGIRRKSDQKDEEIKDLNNKQLVAKHAYDRCDRDLKDERRLNESLQTMIRGYEKETRIRRHTMYTNQLEAERIAREGPRAEVYDITTGRKKE